MTPRINAVCFDLGKVLVDFDWQIFLRRVAEQSPFAPEEITAKMKADPLMLEYEMGQISSPDFFAHQKALLEFGGTPEALRHAFTAIFTPLPEHIALATELSRHYSLGLISNTNEAHITQIVADNAFFPIFDVLVYSHLVHAMKPAPEIYQAALLDLAHQTGEVINPAQTLFIDDLEPNIEGARQLGFQTIHLRPEVNLRNALLGFELKGLS